VWLTTATANGSRTKPVLLRVSASGSMASVKIPVAGGMEFSGVGLGPGNRIWFSGTTDASPHRGVNGTVSGTTAHFALASDSGSWGQLAVVGSTAYLTDGFNDLLTSTNGTTFTNLGLENVSPFDIAPFAGGLALAGDGAIGIVNPAGLAAAPTPARLLTTASPTTLSARYETVAGGQLWFLQQEGGGEVVGLGSAGPAGGATIHRMSGLHNITTGPDGAPWVLTATRAERIGPNGSVTASVKLPAAQTGVLIVGGTSKYVWVATFKRASASAEVVRIATA
jgi:hypothetical protein